MAWTLREGMVTVPTRAKVPDGKIGTLSTSRDILRVNRQCWTTVGLAACFFLQPS